MKLRLRHLPWATALVALLSLTAWASPALSAAWIYDRGAILRGEIWRLWTGNVVHFSASHLLWDLIAFGCTGAWIELQGFHRARLLVLSAPLMVGVAAFAFQPAMVRYAGLSGVATATAAFALLGEAAAGGALLGIWGVALFGLLLEVVLGTVTERPLLSRFGDQAIAISAVSHWAGLLSGILLSAPHSFRQLSQRVPVSPSNARRSLRHLSDVQSIGGKKVSIRTPQ